MKKVTRKELAQILFGITFQKGAAVIASILQYTDAEPKKTNNPYNSIMKLTRLTVLLNTDYEKGVLNQLKREEKEASEYEKGTNTMPLTFGENNHFIGLFTNKKGTIVNEPVIQYRPFDNSHPKSEYFADGLPIEKDKIEHLLPAKRKATNQGTEKEIHWRKVYLKNVREMSIDGQQYQLIDID